MIKLKNTIPVLFVAFMLVNCASQSKTTPVEKTFQEKRMQEALNLIEQNSATLRENKNKLIELEKRLSDIEKKINDTSAVRDSEINEIKENLAFMNDQILRLDKSVPAKPYQQNIQASKQSSVKKSESAITGFKPGGFDVESSYKKAMAEYEANHYETAITGFNEILTIVPESDLADNAQYWIGECYFSLKTYQKAIEAFTKVMSYPKSNKYPDATYKIAKSFIMIGDQKAAKEKLKAVMERYPNSEAAKFSAQELKNLGD